jgi:hypothetical protein
MRRKHGYTVGIGRHCDFCRNCHCRASYLTASGRMSPEVRTCRIYRMRVAWNGSCGRFENRTSVAERTGTANAGGELRRGAP